MTRLLTLKEGVEAAEKIGDFLEELCDDPRDGMRVLAILLVSLSRCIYPLEQGDTVTLELVKSAQKVAKERA